MFQQLKNAWEKRQLRDPKFAFLFQRDGDEVVSIDCETTGLDVKTAEILSIGAVRIRGNTILTSESFYCLVKPEQEMRADNVKIHGLRPKDVEAGLPIQEALYQLLNFIGGRDLVGYYLDFDVAMLNKFLKPLIGIQLPNRQIDISNLYYRHQAKQHIHDSYVDMRLDSILQTLKLPALARHDALNDAITVAQVYLCLNPPKKG